ncbi:MAG: rhomboid family intramembrane serine protease, partial [Sphingobacteriales bacterium]
FYAICGLGAAILHLAVLHQDFSQTEKAFNLYQQDPTLDQFLRLVRERLHLNPAWLEGFSNGWESDPGNPRFANQSIQLIHEYIYGYSDKGVHVRGLFDQPTVGASGAVFGILFAFGYLFPNTLLYIYFLVPLKAKYVVAAYALFELYAGVQNSAGDNVAHFAHLGGMLVAFIVLKVWNKKNRRNFF